MEGEISNFVMVWTGVVVSLFYCYFTARIVPEGFLRLLTFLPIICTFLLLPLNLTSVHLGGLTSFFIAWLANFKLLLFAFGTGPLSFLHKISLGGFIAVACLPIKIRQDPPPESIIKKPQINGQTTVDPKSETLNPKPKQGQFVSDLFRWLDRYSTKVLMFAILLKVYDFSDFIRYIHPKLVLCLYCLHMYLFLDLVLVALAKSAKTLFKFELEPQFNAPYLATSLQDFWGRRWNIMVTNIMRPTVYDPLFRAAARFMGRKWAPIPALLATFMVSALMHELMFYYLGRTRPTWAVTCFFLLHGTCLMVEVAVKRTCGRAWRLPPVVSAPLTLSFLMVTGFWLFFPRLLGCRVDTRALEEYAAVGAFVKDVGRSIRAKSPFFNATGY